MRFGAFQIPSVRGPRRRCRARPSAARRCGSRAFDAEALPLRCSRPTPLRRLRVRGGRRCCRRPAPRRPGPHRASGAGTAPSCRPAHKPHKVNETVTVHYRFHPLAGTRATTLENRSHRGEPIVVVADSDGQRYHLPLWMTAPEAAQWGLRDRPRLSHSALSELRDLIAAWSAELAPPATGDRDEISKAREAAEDADVRAAAPGQPAGGCETGGGGRSGGADCGGDGRHRSGRERRGQG